MEDTIYLLSYYFWPILVIGGIVFLIIYFQKKKNENSGANKWNGLEIFKKIILGVLITVFSAYFIGFFTACFFQSLLGSSQFVMLVILSILSIIIGFYFIEKEAIGYGFMFGGFLSLIYSLIINFSSSGNMIKFVVIAVVLLIVIVFSYRHLKEEHDS